MGDALGVGVGLGVGGEVVASGELHAASRARVAVATAAPRMGRVSQARKGDAYAHCTSTNFSQSGFDCFPIPISAQPLSCSTELSCGRC